MILKNDQLNERFKKFKDSFLGNNFKFGKYWEKEKKTFDVNFKDGNFYSTGTRDYLPIIFNENFVDKQLILLDGKKFIKLGDKVKFTIRFKGREFQNHDQAKELMGRIKEDMLSVSKIEQEPKLEGRQYSMIFTTN